MSLRSPSSSLFDPSSEAAESSLPLPMSDGPRTIVATLLTRLFTRKKEFAISTASETSPFPVTNTFRTPVLAKAFVKSNGKLVVLLNVTATTIQLGSLKSFTRAFPMMAETTAYVIAQMKIGM